MSNSSEKYDPYEDPALPTCDCADWGMTGCLSSCEQYYYLQSKRHNYGEIINKHQVKKLLIGDTCCLTDKPEFVLLVPLNFDEKMEWKLYCKEMTPLSKESRITYFQWLKDKYDDGVIIFAETLIEASYVLNPTQKYEGRKRSTISNSPTK